MAGTKCGAVVIHKLAKCWVRIFNALQWAEQAELQMFMSLCKALCLLRSEANPNHPLEQMLTIEGAMHWLFH